MPTDPSGVTGKRRNHGLTPFGFHDPGASHVVAGSTLGMAEAKPKKEGERARQYLKRDLAVTRVDFTRARESIKRGLSPSRIGGGFVGLASHLFDSMGDVFQSWAARSEEALAFNTGEISGPGKLTCTECGAEFGSALNLERSSRIPPCPKCHKTNFRKSY